jgi:hypothetical protein
MKADEEDEDGCERSCISERISAAKHNRASAGIGSLAVRGQGPQCLDTDGSGVGSRGPGELLQGGKLVMKANKK